MRKFERLETKLIHAGEPEPRVAGAVSMPVFQSSTYLYGGESSYHDIRYLRLNNCPNHLVLHAKLAALENAEAALVTASGMAAISTALLTFLQRGDHLLAQDCLYGGTHELITRELEHLGINHDLIDANRPDTWSTKLRPETRLIYVETITNPLIGVGDLHRVAEFARANGLVSMIDNTFASPVNFRPPEHGFDLSLHSGTKYLNGHTDIVAGAAIGRAEYIDRICHKLNFLGGTLDPHACFLLHRGIKTLALRVRQQNSSAGRIAEYLARHPAVKTVNYPGLRDHPNHALASELLDGFGGMLSFDLEGGLDQAQRFLKRSTLPLEAPSLGGVETLLTLPATTSHAGLPPQERRARGISDSLVRMSVGIEATEDIIDDLAHALDGAAPSGA